MGVHEGSQRSQLRTDAPSVSFERKMLEPPLDNDNTQKARLRGVAGRKVINARSVIHQKLTIEVLGRT